ncbi:hypothetical protein H5410_031478 [Solanum commersonii]|uniref:Transposase-associated domain-containing protein n=1 Tax=Solanum commersonii TaxID=4109 RepID=A0A9J5YLU1_SOLCO|nr:hypothetical protein H5410_031478 [Solanum commersonii]
MDHRLWMYNMHYETGAGLKCEFIDNVRNFIKYTMTLDIFKNNGLVRCPCSACNLFVNTWGNEAIYTKFSKWLRNYVYDEYSSVQHLQVKEVALGPESQVLTMNKYCVNGFKFQTEEVSRNKKTNNSGVYIQGDVDGTGQTIEYYGVIQEIIEVRYLGWPKKKIVLFRYEWFDPSHRGTKISLGGDGDRHREHLEVSRTKQAKKKKSSRPIDPEDIVGSISSAPERINHDTHLFVVPFGTTDPRQYYPNYRRPVGASSTSQALPSRRYEVLPLQAIRQARPLSAGTPFPTCTFPQLSAMRL